MLAMNPPVTLAADKLWQRTSDLAGNDATSFADGGPSGWRLGIRLFGSLKLTVGLLALSLVLVFAGTLAQVDKGIGQVTAEYFRTGIAWIELRIFFPPHWFPHMPVLPGAIPFPGGWLIGYLMAINLLCAHAVRFKVQARGSRLIAGCLLITLGGLSIWLIIASGGQDGVWELSEQPIWFTRMLAKGVLLAAWMGVMAAWVKLVRRRVSQARVVGSVGLALSCLIGWLFCGGDQTLLNESALRILWQLLQGGLASLVAWLGCALIFRRRAGIVLLHTGIGLMMLGELLVGLHAVEGRMRLREGETVNFVEDTRALEIAIVDASAADYDHVVVVPGSMLRPGNRVTHAALPFDLQVTEFFSNSSLQRSRPDQINPATAGLGLEWQVRRETPVSSTEDRVNMPSAYVTILEKGEDQPIATHLLSLHHANLGLAEHVKREENLYEVSLRFRRTYKPYALTLHDFRFDKYIGTSKARNFSSDVRLVDRERGVDRDVRIWMNNPLRYRGETFYQSSFAGANESGREVSVLAVVSNRGWMIPYVSCMLVAVGMCSHFGTNLLEFLQRRARHEAQSRRAVSVQPADGRRLHGSSRPLRVAAWRRAALPLLVLGAALSLIVGVLWPPGLRDGDMQLEQFGRLPVVFEGRVKPFDTLARNCLSLLSCRQTFRDQSGTSQPAIRWLLDVITQSPVAAAHRVFRIDNLELLETLRLARRPGFRYAMQEFTDRLPVLSAQANDARGQDARRLSTYQRKVLELDSKLRLYQVLDDSFRSVEIGPGDEDGSMQEAISLAMRLSVAELPLAVPLETVPGHATWQSFTNAWLIGSHSGVKRDARTMALHNIMQAYRTRDAGLFNRQVFNYLQDLRRRPPEEYRAGHVDFEVLFNRGQLFLWAAVLYLAVFVMGSIAWLGWPASLQRAAHGLLILTFVLHTLALIGRIYISGRPPVTNLYSSAIFIGWGGVLLGLALETVYRLGVGTALAAAAGFATLLIAHFLARSGDTLVVLQAVLDTQFWLATHVTCITLGYATTFVAGGLGILYVVCGVGTPYLKSIGPELRRMIYGTICFALFFSFVGTVLGGLWADDSWGRFWGWDPKENGALMIVLWNALILHARWGGMIKDRGLAVLAVGGNLCTAWSWFGTNELAVGLHSYGFTDGVLRALGWFCLSQLLIMAVGMIPRSRWRSFRPQPSPSPNGPSVGPLMPS